MTPGTAAGDAGVIEWLLDPSQPGVRYRTLTELLGRGPTDPEVRAARSEIPTRGWARALLDQRAEWGGWGGERTLYLPKYLATSWVLPVLADLGLDRSVPELAPTLEMWARRATARTGTFGAISPGSSHYCYAGNVTRAMIDFGYADDPRVAATLEWFVETASHLGGWSCFGSGRNLDSWEALGAFAAYPRERWTPAMERVVAAATEFFLDRELHRQGDRYAPWFRTHYPTHYYYDLLVGLDLLTALGHGGDPRMAFALEWLESRRRPDGRWAVDASHPDVEGAMARWFEAHPKDRPTPLVLEAPGAPSRMITLRALRVLRRAARWAPPRDVPSAPAPPRPSRRRA